MDTFNFPYYTVRRIYPAGDQQKFEKPRLHVRCQVAAVPIQRTFILKFNAMANWLATSSGYGMQDLVLFYEAYEMWDRFTYPHPLYGNLIVRFSKALEVPETLDNGFGHTMPLEIQLIEQPL